MNSSPEQRGANMWARRHCVAEIERAAHRAVQLSRCTRRQPVAIDQDRCLSGAAGIDEQFPQRQHAVLGRATEARAGHRHHDAPHDTLCLGRNRLQTQAGDEFSQGVFELAQKSVLLGWMSR
jgi:hypothetical protein